LRLHEAAQTDEVTSNVLCRVWFSERASTRCHVLEQLGSLAQAIEFGSHTLCRGLVCTQTECRTSL
jgi:hypothetical protein